LSKIAEDVEESLHNQLRSVFRAIRTLTGNTLTSSPATVYKQDGSPSSSTDKTLQPWAEHSTIHLAAHTDEPTLDEVIRAVKKLKNGRALDLTEYPPNS